MKKRNHKSGALLRVILRPGVSIGPGKADLLEGIAETGAIAAAGQRLGMSYKRAWSLIRRMNEAFGAPLVETTRGGRAHGGAALTPLGRTVLDRYRRMESRAAAAIAEDMAALRGVIPESKT